MLRISATTPILLVSLLSILPTQLAAAETYNFSTDTFQLGTWEPKKLDYTGGLRKIRALDNWYYSLPAAEKEKFQKDYVVNRNRLFLVTQEKRMMAEVESKGSTAILRGLDPQKEERRSAAKDLASFRKLSEEILAQPDKLESGLIRNLAQVEQFVSPETASLARGLGGSFAVVNSKSGGAGGGTSFLTHMSMLGGRSVNNTAIEFGLDRLLPDDCKQDAKCRAARARLKAKVEKQQALAAESLAIEKRLRESQEKAALAAKKVEISENPSCSPADKFDYPLEAEFAGFRPKSADFLKQLGISPQGSPSKSRDLSHWYGEPTTQYDEKGNKLATCVGHSIANNVSAALARKKILPMGRINSASVSVDHTYALAKFNEGEAAHRSGAKQLDPNAEGYCDAKAYDIVSDGIESVSATLNAMTTVPLCSKSSAEASTKKYQINKFASVAFSATEKPGFQFFKALIDNGYPPIVQINTDARNESGEWLQFKAFGEFEHVLNVVGYDEGVDPWTLCPTKYFIVRDSLGKRKIHYKVPAANLLSHLQSVYQVTDVGPAGEKSGRPVNTAPSSTDK